MRTNWIRMMVVLALVGAVGCGKKSGETLTEKIIEKAVENATDGQAKVDLSENKVSVQTDKGSVVVDASGTASVPENFPKDVPVPKSTKVMASVSTPEAFVLTLDGPSDVVTALKTFSEEMKTQGWTEETAVNMGGQMVSTFKKDTRLTTITAVPSGDKSAIQVAVTSVK